VLELTQERKDAVFALVEASAARGDRCPTNADLPFGCKNALPALAREGKIRIEVYSRNWRVVTILVGPHRGKKTKAPPVGVGEPYVVIDDEQDRVPGQSQRSKRRLVPYAGSER
jgi:hypothetical protein